MDHRFATGILRISIAVLLAGMLGACATTQRTSSGMGTMDDASAPQPTAANTQAAASQSPAKPQATNPSDATARGLDNAPIAGTSISSEEADRDKKAQAVTSQDAPNQVMDASKPEEPAAKAESQAATASSATAAQPAAATSAAPTVAATKPDDTQVVFPADRNASPSETSTNQVSRKPLEHSVYFDFDKSLIKEQFDAVLKAQAAYLEAHKNFTAEIQGNCDERGSREYNLALGARRAEAVKQALELLGVDGEKLKTVSFGSEKPVALGKDEDSYSKNRRADIVH